MLNRRSFILNAAIATTGISLLKTKAITSLVGKKGLKDFFEGDFLVGTAIGTGILHRNDSEMLDLISSEFNAITTENALKWEQVHPKEKKWNFKIPDRYIDFAQKNNMYTQGHVLVWHSQVPKDLFIDRKGNQISKNTLVKRMEDHITTLVDRYKGKIHSWDVVNESITPEEGYRKSKWHEIIGPEFMERAFHMAHEVDPECHLLYNDYGMDNARRRDFVIDLVNDYKRKGIPIHGIGMQGHFSLDGPDIKKIEDSIEAFASTGLRVHFTEVDVDVLPHKGKRTSEISTNIKYAKSLNPYVDGLPKNMEDKLTKRYEELFKLFLKHRDKIDRVTFWGTCDDHSWKNDFPVRGRTNYPLLWNREHKPKDAYFAVTGLKK